MQDEQSPSGGGPVSSAAWLRHFEENSQAPLDAPWDDGVPLTESERRAVAASIRKFQLGESGEGRHLLRVAADYAEASGDWDYVAALRLFIKEEQQHAAWLGRFLDGHGIPRLSADWSDGAFRWLRHRAGLELSISVLVTAEILAKVYYAALRRATGNLVLRAICERILRDEVQHVRFQCERLGRLRMARGRAGRWLTRLAECSLFSIAMAVLWSGHRSVFRAARLSLVQFIRGAWSEFGAAQRFGDPARWKTLRRAGEREENADRMEMSDGSRVAQIAEGGSFDHGSG